MGMFQKLQDWFNGEEPSELARSMPIVIGPPRGSAVVIRPGDDRERPLRLPALRIAPPSPVKVEAPRRGLWEERGWSCEVRPNLRIYQGEYRIRRGRNRWRWSGRILVENRGDITAYIADPPESLRSHPKWQCFQHEEGRWFRLHWHNRARNVDDTIAYMEKILYEAA